MALGEAGVKALVTGGGGFLGSVIVRQLLARGDQVVVLARGSYPHLEVDGVRLLRGDVRDQLAVEAACAGCDLIFHVAAKPPPWGSAAEYQDINVGGTRVVLAVAKAQGIEHLVYTSTPSVVACSGDVEGADEGLPYAQRFLSEYARSKAEAEREVLAANSAELRTVALRPHLIWGPEDPHFLPRFVARARAGQLRRIGAGDPLVDTVYVDNAAAAHLLAADRLRQGAAIDGRAYFVSNGEPIGVWTMVDRMLAAAGEGPVKGSVPVALASAVAWLCELVYRILPLSGEPRVTRFLVAEVSRAHWFDIGAARRDLGYEPTVSLEEGLARLERWCADRELLQSSS